MDEPQGDDRLAHLERENGALRQENQSLRRFAESMQGILRATESPAAGILDLLGQVLTHALRSLDARDGSLLVLDEDRHELVFAATEGDVPKERLRWRRLRAGDGIAGWVASHRRPATVNNPRADERFYSAMDVELGFRTQSVLAAPMIGGGRVLGVIEALNKHDGQLFSTVDQTLLTLISRFAGELLHGVLSQAPAAESGAGDTGPSDSSPGIETLYLQPRAASE